MASTDRLIFRLVSCLRFEIAEPAGRGAGASGNTTATSPGQRTTRHAATPAQSVVSSTAPDRHRAVGAEAEDSSDSWSADLSGKVVRHCGHFTPPS